MRDSDYILDSYILLDLSDKNYRLNLWNYGKSASEVMSKMTERCDVIFANEEDCEKVFGIKLASFDAGRIFGAGDNLLLLRVV